MPLSEQVKEIINSKGSKNSKKKSLLSIGVTDYEANLLLANIVTNRGERLSFTFGVEIECLARQYSVVQYANENELPIHYESYNHRDNTTYFKFVTDASIVGANGIECVSPILKGKGGFKLLENACKTLNDAGAVVNRSTGLHVHIGASDLTGVQYVNVFKNYQKLEKVIDTFMAQSRRANNSQWCHTLQNVDFDYCTTQKSVELRMNSDRYYKVNPMSWLRHRTIEFRQHQGSTDFKKISMWVNFCAKLVNYSKKHLLTSEITRIEDIPFLNKKEKDFFTERKNTLM